MSACCPALSAQTRVETYSSSGNAFLRLCSAIDDDKATTGERADVIGCIGFVSGFMTGVEAEAGLVMSKMGKKTPEMFCRPDNVEHGRWPTQARFWLVWGCSHVTDLGQRTS